MAEHTPGPWTYQRPVMGRPYDYVVDTEGRPICELNDNRTNYEANARLIAAAPELLECLKVLVNADELTAWDVGAWEEQARQIIARIEGRS